MPFLSLKQPFPGKVCAVLEQSMPILFGSREEIPPSSGLTWVFRAAPGPPDSCPHAEERCKEVRRTHKQQTLLSGTAVGFHIPAAVAPGSQAGQDSAVLIRIRWLK